MRDLTDIEFATMALQSMHPAEMIGVCIAALDTVTDPAQYEALRDAGHKIARHADCLERATRLAAHRDGYCRPEACGGVSGHLSGPGACADTPAADPALSLRRMIAEGRHHG